MNAFLPIQALMYSPPLSSLIKTTHVFLNLPLGLFFNFLIILIGLRKSSWWTSLLSCGPHSQTSQHAGQDLEITSSCSLWVVPGKEEMKTCLRTHYSQAAGKSGRNCSKDRLWAHVPPAPPQVEVRLLLSRAQVRSLGSSRCPLVLLWGLPSYCTWWLAKEQPPPTLDLSSALPDQSHFVAPLFHSKGSLEAGFLLRPPFPGSYTAREQNANCLDLPIWNSSLGTPLLSHPKLHSTFVLLTTAQNYLMFSSWWRIKHRAEPLPYPSCKHTYCKSHLQCIPVHMNFIFSFLKMLS